MSLLIPVEKPQNLLARYRALAPSASIHVSPLQLGGLSIGRTGERDGIGMNKESSFKLLDAYYNIGGNFFDTANSYQNQSSEEFIGEWAEQRGIRDQLVIATKYSISYVQADKNIDILYTSVEEVMNALHILVQQGQVLYLGISDAPAWIVSKCNQYARDHSKSSFVIYQGAWNVMSRDFERDIIPMARMEGMALAPWNVLALGKLRTDAEEERRRQTGEEGRTFPSPDWERNPLEREMSLALEKVVEGVGTPHITAVAIACVMQKAPYVCPVIGGRKTDYHEANVDALRITLTAEHIKFLESIVPFDAGFPHNLIGNGTDYMFVLKTAAYLVKQPSLAHIRPSP